MPSTEPKAVRVNKTSGTGMEIDWADGHKSVYTFQRLRDACPCAMCDDEREKSGAQFGEAPKPKSALPMYREPARPTEVTPVGKYAISFVWNDGHQTGIYSWEFLRMICPCEECKAIRAAGGKLVPGGSGAIYG
jgi:DUF971 family protein